MHTHRVVVVGTGAGGLSAAAHLAKRGFEVLALERAERIGGLLSPFERDGYLFSPGVHYVGECAPGEAFDRALSDLGLSAAELMAEMDPDAYDTYRFPGLEVRACRGRDAYRERLREHFPEDHRGIDHVFSALDALRRMSRVLDHVADPRELTATDLFDAFESLPLLPYLRATYKTFLDREVSDPGLRAVLAGPCGDYGLPPGRASALLGLAIVAHYLEGAFYPRGGSGPLRDAIRGVAEANGAVFRTGAEVARLHVGAGEVEAVELADGERMEADAVVAAVDPRHVFGALLERRAVPPKLRARVRRTTSSLSALTLFLGVDRDLREVGLTAGNLWDYPSLDIDALFEPLFHGKMPEERVLFISPNSLKDPTGSTAPAGKTALEVTALAPIGLFGAWAHVPHDERGDDYHRLRERLQRELLATLDARVPGVVEHAEVVDLSTPLAMEHWVGAIDGGLYGPAQTPEQSFLFRFPTATFLPNLVLAGAGVLGGGVLPCIQSGRAAAARIASRLPAAR